MVDWVNGLHAVRQLQRVGLGPNLRDDLERSELLVGELRRWAGGAEELRFDEDLVSDVELRRS